MMSGSSNTGTKVNGKKSLKTGQDMAEALEEAKESLGAEGPSSSPGADAPSTSHDANAPSSSPGADAPASPQKRSEGSDA